ncbi:unnamed protein product [Cunninghamella blakesleeana]
MYVQPQPHEYPIIKNEMTYQQQQQNPIINISPPPLPSLLPLDIDQLSDFVSTMIYLMWNLRRSSIMDIHIASLKGNHLQTHFIQQEDILLLHHINNNNNNNSNNNNNNNMKNKNTDLNHHHHGIDKAFKRFCHQILSVTQLSESVVILSLKYIAILLQNNPRIQGADGSEYRLFIVALLLANKFQDDNTYTNKTWSDISRMKLNELDIMEFEFLDVLKYRLFIRKEEYDCWKLGLFDFMNQLKNMNLLQEQKIIESNLMSDMDLMVPPTPHSSTFVSAAPPIITTANPNQHVNHLTPEQHYLYLLSKIQLPIIPQQPHSPLTRVPLRIPIHPVYTITPIQSNHTTPITIYSQPPSQCTILTNHTNTNTNIHNSYNNNNNHNNNHNHNNHNNNIYSNDTINNMSLNSIPPPITIISSSSSSSSSISAAPLNIDPLSFHQQPSSSSFMNPNLIPPITTALPVITPITHLSYPKITPSSSSTITGKGFQPYQRSHHHHHHHHQQQQQHHQPHQPYTMDSFYSWKKDQQQQKKRSRLRAQSNPTNFVSQINK